MGVRSRSAGTTSLSGFDKQFLFAQTAGLEYIPSVLRAYFFEKKAVDLAANCANYAN